MSNAPCWCWSAVWIWPGPVSSAKLIADGDTWMAMIKARNQSSHSYNLEQAQQIAEEVIHRYLAAFAALRQRFAALSAETV